MRRSWFRKSIALGLVEVMAITSMLWAAPPQPRRPGPPPHLTPYTFEEPTIVKLARAYEKMLEAASAIETAEPSPVAALEPPSPPPPPPPPPPPSPLPSGPELVAAFAFGADEFTLPGYIKVVQDGPNFLYTPARGSATATSPVSTPPPTTAASSRAMPRSTTSSSAPTREVALCSGWTCPAAITDWLPQAGTSN